MLTDYFGPMFAEKTHTLRAAGVKELVAKRHVLAYKHVKDKARYGENLMTHDGFSFPGKTVENAVQIYEHMRKEVKRNKIRNLSRLVILIDEVQFFTPDIIDFCAEFKPYMGIYTAHLDRDFLARPFKFEKSEKTVGHLMALADRRIALTAVCNYTKRESLDPCSEPASFTQRVDKHGMPILTGKTVEVGGDEKYAPRCIKCYVPHQGDHAIFSPEDLLFASEEKRENKRR
ncbi:thymidine kinase [Nanoarchaeota archaeon]